VKSANFRAANAVRQADAAARDAAVARAVLARPLSVAGLTRTEAAVARGRLDHPGDTWTELAARLGITRASASGAMRRLRARAEVLS
jgi:DNA-binding MarR family transcriptional regulator